MSSPLVGQNTGTDGSDGGEEEESPDSSKLKKHTSRLRKRKRPSEKAAFRPSKLTKTNFGLAAGRLEERKRNKEMHPY